MSATDKPQTEEQFKSEVIRMSLENIETIRELLDLQEKLLKEDFEGLKKLGMKDLPRKVLNRAQRNSCDLIEKLYECIYKYVRKRK